MREHGSLTKDEETNAAGWEAARGAGVGAARWAIYGGILAGAGYAFSPLYRSFTPQFKVFIQMSFMTVGSMMEADRRLRGFEQRVRYQRRLARDTEVWRRFEEDFEEKGTPGVGGEGRVRRPATGDGL